MMMTTSTVPRRDRKAVQIATNPAVLPKPPPPAENRPSSPSSATATHSRPKRPSHSSARVPTSVPISSKSDLPPHAGASAMRARVWGQEGCLASCEYFPDYLSSPSRVGKTERTQALTASNVKSPDRRLRLPPRRLCVSTNSHAPARMAPVAELWHVGWDREFRQGTLRPFASLSFASTVSSSPTALFLTSLWKSGRRNHPNFLPRPSHPFFALPVTVVQSASPGIQPSVYFGQR